MRFPARELFLCSHAIGSNFYTHSLIFSSHCKFQGVVVAISFSSLSSINDVMRSSRAVWLPKRLSRNSPGFDHSIMRHSGIWGAADEAVLKKVHKKNPKNPPVKYQRTGDWCKPGSMMTLICVVNASGSRVSLIPARDLIFRIFEEKLRNCQNLGAEEKQIDEKSLE